MNSSIMHADGAWRSAVEEVLRKGRSSQPRGMKTLDVAQLTVAVDARQPVLVAPARKLSYRFMAAEAYWILSGDDRVDTIAPYNSKIADFSDDGQTFYGAYGPRIASQLRYVVDKLVSDRDSRQAGLTIWKECPPQTKDVPCTVAAFFRRRECFADVHVFMRSSDVWLGLPYDVFNFSMLLHLVCCKLNAALSREEAPTVPGTVYVTAASSHLYDRNLEDARACLVEPASYPARLTPAELYTTEATLHSRLRALRDVGKGDKLRWWES